MAALIAMLRERSGMLLDQTAAASCMSLYKMVMGGRERFSAVAAAKIERLLPDVDLAVFRVLLRPFDISGILDDSETAEPCSRFQMFHDRAPERQPPLEKAGAGSRSKECRLEARASLVMIVFCLSSIGFKAEACLQRIVGSCDNYIKYRENHQYQAYDG